MLHVTSASYTDATVVTVLFVAAGIIATVGVCIVSACHSCSYLGGCFLIVSAAFIAVLTVAAVLVVAFDSIADDI